MFRMKVYRYLISILLIMLSISLLANPEGDKAPDPADTRVVQSLFREALVSGEAYKLLDHLCNKIGHRLSGSEGAEKAVQWTKKVMEDYGFDNVFLQEVMVPHWERGGKEVVQVMSAGKTMDLSVLAIGGSEPTPAQGLSAEVLEVQYLDDLDELGEAGVKGKIVFFNRKFDHSNFGGGGGYGGAVDQRVRGASRAAKYGAIGVVIRSVTSAFDDHPHTGTLVYNDSLPRIPAAALGFQSADRLTEVLKEEPKAKLYMHISSKWHPDALSHNVVGELKGSEFPDEIILVGGHLDSWDVGQGAHDDGSGCMQSIAVLHTFQKLGIKPKRTIRAVMFMNEENGVRGGQKYADLAGENKENHILAIESDAGGFSPRGFGVSAPDAVLDKFRSWLPHFDRNTILFFSRGGGGVDIGPLHRDHGVPMVGLSTDTQRLFDYHHAPNDVFEAVNRRELELGTGAMAALIYLVDKYGM